MPACPCQTASTQSPPSVRSSRLMRGSPVLPCGVWCVGGGQIAKEVKSLAKAHPERPIRFRATSDAASPCSHLVVSDARCRRTLKVRTHGATAPPTPSSNHPCHLLSTRTSRWTPSPLTPWPLCGGARACMHAWLAGWPGGVRCCSRWPGARPSCERSGSTTAHSSAGRREGRREGRQDMASCHQCV